MKLRLVFIVLLLQAGLSLAQEEMKNVYNSYSEVYGGMEDGGISRIESYVFVVYRKIELKNLFYEDKALVLGKGDTLIVHVSKYIPYKTPRLNEEGKQIQHQKTEWPGDRATVTKTGPTFHAHVPVSHTWYGKLDYCYRRKTRTVGIREGFDRGNSEYAP